MIKVAGGVVFLLLFLVFFVQILEQIFSCSSTLRIFLLFFQGVVFFVNWGGDLVVFAGRLHGEILDDGFVVGVVQMADESRGSGVLVFEMLEALLGSLDSLQILKVAEFAQVPELVVHLAAFVEIEGLRELGLVDALQLLREPIWVGVFGDLRTARSLGGIRVVGLEADEALRSHGAGTTPGR